MGTEVIAVPEGADLVLDLRFESVMEGILVSGEVTGDAVGECVRCLDQVTHAVSADIQELFVYPDRSVDNDDEVVSTLHDETVNLEGTVRDAVVLTLPFQPVCSPDCPGLCSECGAALRDDPDHSHQTQDPRWAALTDLRLDARQDT
jgi:uncharacterized protein